MNVSFVPTHADSMDPRLQYSLAQCKAGGEEPKFASADDGYMPVLAKVSDLRGWKALTQVQPGMEIACNQKWIVTARIPISQIEFLHRLPFVESLKATSRVVQPLMKDTLKEIGLHPPVNIPTQLLDQGGKGVVVGIVDFGCDFVHKNFIKPSQKTRIHSIWHQAGMSSSESPYGYGKVHSRAEINAALKTQDPYATLNYCSKPHKDVKGKLIVEHGTHVMDIAAGGGATPGVAPQAKIMFVELGVVRGKKLADSVSVVEAVKYIFDQAGDRPCVVNLSLGQHGGAHDGTGLVEQAFDAILKEKPNRAIVISAGNSYENKGHCSGKVQNGKFVDIKWVFEPFDNTENQLEIWYSGQDEYEVEIIYKDGRTLARFSLGSNGFLATNKDGQSVKMAYASHRKHDPNNGDNVFQMFQDPNLDIQGGTWTLRLHGKRVITDGTFHAWIERDDSYPSTFEHYDQNYTLGSIATGYKTIVVGSYDAHSSETPISFFSSAGPTRDGRPKPEVSAPGHRVRAALSYSINGTTCQSGTSMAAPVVTGLVARLLGQAKIKKILLNIDRIRDVIISTCRRNPPESKDWHPQYGNGRVSAMAILAIDSTSFAVPVVPVPDPNVAADLPSWVFGAEEWKKYIGDPGDFPPLDPEIRKRLPELKNTNILVFIPETVNGIPLDDVRNLDKLFSKPRQGYAANIKSMYRNVAYAFRNSLPTKSHWALLTRDLLQGSREKKYDEVEPILEKYSRESKICYRIPTLLDIFICLCMEHVRTGKWLYADTTATFCQEKPDDYRHYVIGNGSTNGITIAHTDTEGGKYIGHGVAGLYKC